MKSPFICTKFLIGSISFKSIEIIFELLKFLEMNWDQLPGAAPRSMTRVLFLMRLNLLFISSNLYTALDL